MVGGGGGSTTTWDPTAYSGYPGAGGTFTNGNKTVTLANGKNWATVSAASGKKYYEAVVDVVGSSFSPMIGIATTSVNTGGSIFFAAGCWCIACQGTKYVTSPSAYTNTGATISAGSVIGVAVDIDAGYIWWAVNNVWVLSGNPSAGTSPAFTGVTGTLRPANSAISPGKITARFNASTFTYPAPTGFLEW